MTRSYRFEITAEAAGQRLDEFLASELGTLSRMRIASLIESGACLVGGIASRAGHRLSAGEVVEVAIVDDRPTAMTPEPLPLEIVYEDEQILVIVKPAGMLVHPTKSVRTGTLANALAHHLNLKSQNSDLRFIVRPGLVHRLDRATSGLMVVAKTARALAVLSRHFQRRLVEKRYAAIVQGVVTEDEETIIAPIGRDPEARPQWRVMENGRHAETRLRVLKRGERATLVELEPVTGRTNQLRIHCAHRGHPVVGDQMYASDHSARLCLHAWRLCFHHPAGGRWMEFASMLPVEMTKALADEGIYGFDQVWRASL
ncbi:MAG TPA: RluA family pseudouridine synthase [Blastocatellia bacterium]|nr:RluA family pseudouridine synthase [Blastocatellia bacterium]